MGKLIAFNVPYIPKASKKYALDALESSHQQGDGSFTTEVSKIVSDLVGGGHVFLTPSCTHALEMASMLGNIGPGDEVILPSYTFTSAATAVTKFGATPVFVDIEVETKGIDVYQVRDAISPRTKAISWVNYAGVAPDIESLQSIAKDFNLLLIEDNAHGLGGTYKNRPLGSFGDFATQSFHATKNFQCGEGGALVINNSKYIDRARTIRDKGTNRSRFLEGKVEKYKWVDHGSSYLLAEYLAAILLGQLENFEQIQNIRKGIYSKYIEKLSIPKGVRRIGDISNIYHMLSIEFIDKTLLNNFEKGMKNYNISTATHYEPLHLSPMGQKYKSNIPNNSISQQVADTLIRMPIYPDIVNFDLEKIIDHTNNVLNDI
jgi:dTDP-4-amino-4,6-dideoxygalactose transaminase